MVNFKYRASVIVPVYNTEEYLPKCLESLVNQTIDKDNIEVFLINDGSEDRSLSICKEYAEAFPFFNVIDKENEGVSASRNLGIRMARGKYIFYLDSDDTLSSNAIQDVVNFFEKHYEEIDMVSYYDQYYTNGVKDTQTHIRYKFLTKTGVYDLDETPYALQLRLSMCTKNMLDENIFFDENMGYQEDQAYCSELLSRKMKLGYVKEAVYNYNKNEAGTVANSTNPIVMFEKTTSYFEHFFEGESVPKYYQALFFHDIQWKFTSSCLYPYHYDGHDLKMAKTRIQNMLRKVDDSIIMKHPGLDNYQKLFWIRQKKQEKLVPILESNRMLLFSDDYRLYDRKNVEIILKRVVLRNGIFKMIGYFKSPFFSLIDDCQFYVYENECKKKLSVKIASNSYYKAKEQTDTFYSFSYKYKAEDDATIRFSVVMDGVEYKTSYWMPKDVPFSKEAGYSVIYNQGVRVEFSENAFFISTVEENEGMNIISNNTKKVKKVSIANIRSFYERNCKRKIWLYTDNYSVTYDNAWQQFIHDFDKNDGIERYYIVTNQQDNYIRNQELYQNNLIEYGSLRHKLLFTCAEKLFTSFIETEVCFPYSQEEMVKLSDIINVEIIYLQHGVLHAHLPWYYSPTQVKVDKEVVSTNFEIENLSTNYGFFREDLIPAGMPRYDFIDRKKKPERKILFAPSWRSYLTGNMVSGNMVRQGNKEKLVVSNYYKNIEKFINSEKLQRVLEKYNMNLYLKLHPEFFGTYADVDWILNPNVKLADNRVDLAQFDVFMTDFSSFVFDYAVLKRPIIYYVPDYLEFKAGLNRYRELDLPYEKAFGPLCVTPEQAVEQLENILNADCKAKKIYEERMSNFYLNLENCRERIYQFIINEKEL